MDDVTQGDEVVDTDVRAALSGIDAGRPLRVDVDELIVRGHRRRRLVVAERALTVGLVAVIVAVAGLATVRAGAPHSSPAIEATGSAAPTPGPSTSEAPTPSSSATSSVTIDPKLPSLLTFDSVSTVGDVVSSHGANSAFGYKNRTSGTVTITGWHIVDPSGATTGALFGPEQGDYNADFQPPQVAAVLGAAPRYTADVAAGQTIFLFLHIQATCTASDKDIRPMVVIDARAADGTVGQTLIRPGDGFDVGFGMPYDGWVQATIAGACPSSAPLPTATAPSAPLTVGGTATNGSLASGYAVTTFQLRNSTAHPMTIIDWAVVDPTGSTTAALQKPVPLGRTPAVGGLAHDTAAAHAAHLHDVAVAAGQTVQLVAQISPHCTAADSAIQPMIELSLRLADGSTTQLVIRPTDEAAPGQSRPGWVQETLDQACRTS